MCFKLFEEMNYTKGLAYISLYKIKRRLQYANQFNNQWNLHVILLPKNIWNSNNEYSIFLKWHKNLCNSYNFKSVWSMSKCKNNIILKSPSSFKFKALRLSVEIIIGYSSSSPPSGHASWEKYFNTKLLLLRKFT